MRMVHFWAFLLLSNLHLVRAVHVQLGSTLLHNSLSALKTTQRLSTHLPFMIKKNGIYQDIPQANNIQFQIYKGSLRWYRKPHPQYKVTSAYLESVGDQGRAELPMDRLNINMPSHQFRDSHNKDKTVWRASRHYNRNLYTRKTAFMYYQYGDSHYKHKTVWRPWRPFPLYNGNLHTVKCGVYIEMGSCSK